MPHEVELKFDLDPCDLASVRAAPALDGQTSDAREHDTVYFDTADRALRRSGYSLRVRRSGDRFVQTVKHKGAGAVGLFVRREWETEVPTFAVAADALKPGAVKRILARAGPDALRPLVRTAFCRTRWTIDYDGSRIEMVLDEGRVVSGDVEAPLCELELELVRGKPGALFRLAEQLGATVPLRLGVLSKAERGYALADELLGGASKATPVRLAPSMSQGDAFCAVAYACLRHFRLNEIALLSGQSAPEALHQARVALRRLRSGFALFRPVLAGKESRHLRRELRWLARRLGDARNIDVLIARHGTEGEPPDQLLARRQRAYARVDDALRSQRARSLFLQLAMWIEAGSWRSRGRASDDMASFAERQLDRQWAKVAKRGPDIARLDPDDQHRLRIAVKKLRYSAEFLSGLHGRKPASRSRDSFLVALRMLQERLGDLNDEQLDQESMTRGADGTRAAPPAAGSALLSAAQKAFDRAATAAGYWRMP